MRDELRAIYAEVARDLAARPGLYCELSGRCCRFKEADHQLFLTRPEFEEMVRHGGAKAGDGSVCPWLKDGRCDNREGRALACRTYFCSDEEEAAAVTETWHRRIRQLHAESGVPYEYSSLAHFLNSEATNSSDET